MQIKMNSKSCKNSCSMSHLNGLIKNKFESIVEIMISCECDSRFDENLEVIRPHMHATTATAVATANLPL